MTVLYRKKSPAEGLWVRAPHRRRPLTAGAVVIHVDDGVVDLIREEIRPVEAVLRVQDAFLVGRVEHGRLALEAVRVEAVQTSSHTFLGRGGGDDLPGEANKQLLGEDIEMEGTRADAVTLSMMIFLNYGPLDYGDTALGEELGSGSVVLLTGSVDTAIGGGELYSVAILKLILFSEKQ